MGELLRIKHPPGVQSAGPSTDNALVRWHGASGKVIQNSGITIDDNDDISIGAHKIKGNYGLLKQGDSSSWYFRNLADDAYQNIHANNLKLESFIRFYEGGNYVGFEAPALSASQIWVLPTADGSNGDYLKTNGSGALSWDTPAGGGDMLAATYDPQTVGGDAFDCDNHTDGSTNGVYTLTERTKLATVDSNADVTGDNAPQAHKDSHDPNDGGDPLDCAAAGEITGVVAASEGTAHSFARSDHVHQIQHAITDNHIVTVDGSPNDDEIARFTANGIEGLTYAETMTALFSVDAPEQMAITLDDTLSADGKYCVTMALDGTAGGDGIAFGECVYFDSATSKWKKAQGDAEATLKPMTGLSLSSGDTDDPLKIAIIGEVRADTAFPALTVGAPVFISAGTAGDVTTTELTTGQFQKAIGWAKTANVVVLTGNPDWVKVG
jgi:hypothetical protein